MKIVRKNYVRNDEFTVDMIEVIMKRNESLNNF
jgi:hypothetical protein